MNWSDPTWQAYALWLQDRGMTTPRWIHVEALASEPVASSVDLVFVSDLELKPDEHELLAKIANAMNAQSWVVDVGISDPSILASGVPGAEVLDQLGSDIWGRLPAAKAYVAFGPLTTRVMIGKGSFKEMRGKVQANREHKIIPTYHPRDILKNASLKRDVWTDMQQVMSSCQS